MVTDKKKNYAKNNEYYGGLCQVSPLIVMLKPKKSFKRDMSFCLEGN